MPKQGHFLCFQGPRLAGLVTSSHSSYQHDGQQHLHVDRSAVEDDVAAASGSCSEKAMRFALWPIPPRQIQTIVCGLLFPSPPTRQSVNRLEPLLKVPSTSHSWRLDTHFSQQALRASCSGQQDSLSLRLNSQLAFVRLSWWSMSTSYKSLPADCSFRLPCVPDMSNSRFLVDPPLPIAANTALNSAHGPYLTPPPSPCRALPMIDGQFCHWGHLKPINDGSPFTRYFFSRQKTQYVLGFSSQADVRVHVPGICKLLPPFVSFSRR